MVDIGAQFSPLPGTNEKNIYLYNYGEDGLDTLSQRVKSELTVTSRTNNQPWPEVLGPNSQPRVPPVKYQINGGNPEQEDWENMPAAASSFNVGGQAAHWTCCTPRPEPVERIPFIDGDEWERLITRGEQLLKTNQVSFTESPPRPSHKGQPFGPVRRQASKRPAGSNAPPRVRTPQQDVGAMDWSGHHSWPCRAGKNTLKPLWSCAPKQFAVSC